MAPSLETGNDHRRHSSVTQVPVKLPKKLIICCDGTWMNSDNGWVPGKWGSSGHPQNPSNVTRIARAISNEDHGHHQQIVYYQAGVGTGLGLYNHLVGGGTGLGLSENIREAYAFLASNYAEHDHLVPPDSIFLIGFSRGAFTARSIGGFIGAVGILKKTAMPHFYEIFQDWENAGNKKYKPQFFESYFKVPRNVKPIKSRDDLAHSMHTITEYMDDYREKLLDLGLTQEAKIKCIGVWDTVGALGIPVNPILQQALPFLPSFIRDYSWFDTTLDKCIENAFHALALDERRFPYSPAVWEKPNNSNTNLKQVWFPGAHSNVGGSYSDTGMADITIAWMMDQLAGHSRPADKHFDEIDWIRFDQKYIDHWYDLEVEQYKLPQKHFRGWGLGQVYDSLNFPQNLAGKKTRMPGRYHRTFYTTGDSDPKHLLHDTCEYIHSSVRARMELGGLSQEPDWDQGGIGAWFKWWYYRMLHGTWPKYQPQAKNSPLHGWELLDGHKSHATPNMNVDGHIEGPIKWVWKGKGEVDKGTLLEDKLGLFEHLLLKKDVKICDQIEVSNGGFVRILKAAMEHLRHAQTI